MPKSIREAMNRGNNLMIVVFLTVLGVGLISLIIGENDLIDKGDDAWVSLLAIVGVVWYLWGRNRYQYSWTPFILLALAFVGKVGGLANEINDPASSGDEFGIVPILAILLIISAVILVRARSYNRELGTGFATDAPVPVTGAPEDPDDPQI